MEEALLDQVEEPSDHRSLLNTRQQQYLDLLRDPAFHYQHLTRVTMRPVADNTQSGFLEPVHNIWPPDAFSEPCASNPKPKTRLTMAFGREPRFPVSVGFDDRPGPGHYDGVRVVPGRMQPGGEQLVGNSSHAYLVPRRAVRWTAENNVATGPGKYDLPLPLLSGTPSSRPTSFSKGERTFSHVKPPATNAIYDTPSLPVGQPSGPGSSGHSFTKAARGLGQDDTILAPRSTPGPGQYNPRYTKRDKAVPVAKVLGKWKEPWPDMNPPPGPGAYVVPSLANDPTTVPGATSAPCFSFAAQGYSAPVLDPEQKQAKLERSRTAQQLYATLLTPDGRRSELRRLVESRADHAERCRSAPRRRLAMQIEQGAMAEERRESRAALYGQEGAEARRALRSTLMRQQQGWLTALTLGRSVAPLLARLVISREERQREAEAKALLRVWRGTAAETNQAKVDEGRERVCARRVEKALRDWIFRLRLRKWREATTRIVGFLSTTGSTSLMSRAVRRLTYRVRQMQAAWRRRTAALEGRLDLCELQWLRMEPDRIEIAAAASARPTACGGGEAATHSEAAAPGGSIPSGSTPDLHAAARPTETLTTSASASAIVAPGAAVRSGSGLKGGGRGGKRASKGNLRLKGRKGGDAGGSELPRRVPRHERRALLKAALHAQWVQYRRSIQAYEQRALVAVNHQRDQRRLQAIKDAAHQLMHKNESPGSFQNLERKRRDSLLVRNVSPSKQQVTRTAGITELARAELPAAELTELGPRPHFGLVLSRAVLVGLVDEAIMSPAGYHPHQHAP